MELKIDRVIEILWNHSQYNLNRYCVTAYIVKANRSEFISRFEKLYAKRKNDGFHEDGDLLIEVAIDAADWLGLDCLMYDDYGDVIVNHDRSSSRYDPVELSCDLPFYHEVIIQQQK